MARVLICCVMAVTAIGLAGCGNATRPGLVLIEPSYSHLRDPMAASPGDAPIGVTASAETQGR